jgi:hypothetical protein
MEHKSAFHSGLCLSITQDTLTNKEERGKRGTCMSKTEKDYAIHDGTHLILSAVLCHDGISHVNQCGLDNVHLAIQSLARVKFIHCAISCVESRTSSSSNIPRMTRCVENEERS